MENIDKTGLQPEYPGQNQDEGLLQNKHTCSRSLIIAVILQPICIDMGNCSLVHHVIQFGYHAKYQSTYKDWKPNNSSSDSEI